MKQMTVGAAVVLLVGLVVGLSVNAMRPSPVDLALKPAVVKDDLMTLWSAYHRNAVDADHRYAGGLVELTGPVLSVNKKEGEVCLFLFDLDIQGKRLARARCLFASREYPELARLLRREKVTVRGKASWEPASLVGSAIVLRDCVLVAQGK